MTLHSFHEGNIRLRSDIGHANLESAMAVHDAMTPLARVPRVISPDHLPDAMPHTILQLQRCFRRFCCWTHAYVMRHALDMLGRDTTSSARLKLALVAGPIGILYLSRAMHAAGIAAAVWALQPTTFHVPVQSSPAPSL